MKLLLLGMNHRTAPLAVRERYAPVDGHALLEKLVADDAIAEAALVATCNRVEVIAAVRDAAAARHRLRAFFSRDLDRDAGRSDPALEGSLYDYADAAAVRHLFRVAASIDSMVVGEPQILGQVKDAWRESLACGACGPLLSRLFQHAFSAAKRVRSETRIAERPISVAKVAAELALEVFEDLEEKAALLLGAGEMIELALERLRDAGLGRVRVVNRTPARAEALAARFDASAHGLDALPELLASSDVVLTGIATDAPLLGRREFEAALATRRRRPIFVVDLGVPRNVAPEVDALDEVYRYDVDDLSGAAAANAEERRREVTLAEALVAEEEQRFAGWMAALAAVPTIRDLRRRAESIRTRELERVAARLALDPEQRAGVEALTRAIVNKLLHPPLARLREHSEREPGLAALEEVRALFGLDDPEPRDDEPTEPP